MADRGDRQDREEYLARKAQLARILTVYGRNAVLEALADERLACHTLHLARSNREGGVVAQLREIARHRGVPVKEHEREALARISRNGRQDQGVALDIHCPAFDSVSGYLNRASRAAAPRLLALDGVTNPQNLGMIIRCVAAAGMDGLILARRGNAALGPLVIKASAGTVFKAPLLHCENLPDALRACRDAGARIFTLDARARDSLFAVGSDGFSVFVLGNETTGVTAAVQALVDGRLGIPMANGVESLNVAVTAGLVAYAVRLGKTYLDK